MKELLSITREHVLVNVLLAVLQDGLRRPILLVYVNAPKKSNVHRVGILTKLLADVNVIRSAVLKGTIYLRPRAHVDVKDFSLLGMWCCRRLSCLEVESSTWNRLWRAATEVMFAFVICFSIDS